MLTPRYRIGKKPEEEIPKIFKELGYPFMISKTAMYALGSPHTWPTILAALVWMVDLIKVTYLYLMQQVVTNCIQLCNLELKFRSSEYIVYSHMY